LSMVLMAATMAALSVAPLATACSAFLSMVLTREEYD
jgi:hypothetical protein